jgi:UDP-N-acetylglucosamine--N-acetylmuramyl-(pentapeptide) pyrophosphoryl-undecaprenol N-acetylglucosamine transferase
MKILLAGGGTGGHVYPAIALAEESWRRDTASRILFVGSRAGMEAALVPAAGISFAGLSVRPPRSRAWSRSAVSLATGLASLGEAAAVVMRFRPDVIVATGGIAAAPPVLVGAALRIPVVVVEGNAFPGRVNRILARFSRAVAVTSSQAASRFPAGRATVTGLPVRRDVYSADRADGIQRFGLDPGRRTVLILGGSQGAARLNAAAGEAVQSLAHIGIQVLHQVGAGWAASRGSVEVAEISGVRYVRVPYLDPIGPAYACADLVVSRCGAAALAEITAAGRPAILVPYRHAAGSHQAQNAAPLVDGGAAVLISDGALDGTVLAREIAALFGSPGRLEAMAGCARLLGRPDAAAGVLTLVAGLIGRPVTQGATP